LPHPHFEIRLSNGFQLLGRSIGRYILVIDHRHSTQIDTKSLQLVCLFLLSLAFTSSLPPSTTMADTDTDTATAAALNAAVEAMHDGDNNMYDVTIVCTTDDHQAAYWMDRLASGICSRSNYNKDAANANKDTKFPMVLAVSEDWGGAGAGAGNGLGTLYAFQKAHGLALEKYGVDLTAELAQGRVSAGLFHTAGKGTRMAPLPASENNNKPGVVCIYYCIYCIVYLLHCMEDPFVVLSFFHNCMHLSYCYILTPDSHSLSLSLTYYLPSYNLFQKLPFGLRRSDGTFQTSLTVLEAVILQTGIYASSRKGRLSVYWGDQVFIPSARNFRYTPTHHIDIMCTLLGDTAPTAAEWKERGLDKYGVIACIETTTKATKEGSAGSSAGSAGAGRLDAAQVDKVSHETAVAMLAKLGKIRQVGPSLGSFSVSAAMLSALCFEFDAELQEKTAKLDTDPHFWMPLTLSEEDYVTLMKQKGTEEAESTKHHARMTAMKASFHMGDNNENDLGLFGAVDVGKNACWWDYGMLRLYSKNSLLLLEKDTAESDLLRKFLGVTSHHVDSVLLPGVTVDEASYAFGSKAKTGSITNSILAQVQAAEINADGAIIVNCAAKKITAGKGAILYNLIDDTDEGIVAAPGQVMVATTNEAGVSTVLKSHLDIDGGKAWKIKLDDNALSFEDVHAQNKNSNIGEIQTRRQENYDKVVASLGF
jgi:hypothetical protein